MTNRSSIKYISSLLDRPGAVAEGDYKSVSVFRQSFPYFVPVRYVDALERYRKNQFDPELLAAIRPYMGDWLLFCDFVQAESGKQQAIAPAQEEPIQAPATAQAAPVAAAAQPVAQDTNKQPRQLSEKEKQREREKERQREKQREADRRRELAKAKPAMPVAEPIHIEQPITEAQSVAAEPVTVIADAIPLIATVEPAPAAQELPVPASVTEEPQAIEPEIIIPEVVAATPVAAAAPEDIIVQAIAIPEAVAVPEIVHEPVAAEPVLAKEEPAAQAIATVLPAEQPTSVPPKETPEEMAPATPQPKEAEKEPAPPPPAKGRTNFEIPDMGNNDAGKSQLVMPVFSEDYFLQQGVKISRDIPDGIDELKMPHKEEEPKSLMVMMSFSEWLVHFKHSAEKQKEETDEQRALKTMWQKEKMAAAMEEENEEIPENVFELAVNSILSEDGLASESLADIYIKQKKYDKAIEMYRKLSLRNPQKNAYFARKIEEVLKEKQS